MRGQPGAVENEEWLHDGRLFPQLSSGLWRVFLWWPFFLITRLHLVRITSSFLSQFPADVWIGESGPADPEGKAKGKVYPHTSRHAISASSFT